MKSTINLIITLKDRYLQKSEALEIAFILLKEKNINTKIQIAGKNKYFLKFEDLMLKEADYKNIYIYLMKQGLCVFCETKKHTDRVKRVIKNEKRKEEQEEINVLFSKIS